MMQLVYQSVVYLLAPIACLVLLWRGLRDRSYWQDLPERFGFGSSTTEPAIWVHAVSVGEVQAAVALVQSLRRRYPGVPLVLTTVTPTGKARAQDQRRAASG